MCDATPARIAVLQSNVWAKMILLMLQTY